MANVATIQLDVDAGGGIRALRQFGDAAERTASRATTLERGARLLSSALAVIGVSTGFLAALREAQQFEQQMALVATVTDKTAVSMQQLSAQSLALFRALPVKSLDDVTKGLYDVISAGVPAGDALKYMDVAARASIAGVTSTAVAVDALTTATNAWRGQNLTAATAADQMFMAVNKGKMTFGDLASSIGTVAPLAAAYKIELSDVLGATAQLTLGGLSAAESMTGIRSAITNIINPTGKLAQAFPALAKEFNATKLEAEGFSRFLIDFNRAAGGSKDALNALFTDVQGKTAVFSLLSDGGRALEQQLGFVKNATGSMGAAFSDATNTSQALNQQLRNELTAQLVELGTAALPLVNRAMAALVSGLQGLRALREHRDELHDLALMLGSVATMYTVVRVAQAAMVLPSVVSFIFNVQAAFAAASVAGTGFMGVMVGLRGMLGINALLATLSTTIFSVQAAFAAAAVAGTGFMGVLAGLTPLMAPLLVGITPLVLLATAGALAMYTLTKAFEDYDDKVEEAGRNTKEYVAYLKALGHAHSQAGGAGQFAPAPTTVPPPPPGGGAVDTADAFRDELAQRDLEIAKQRALTAATGQSTLALALLANRYDAMAEVQKNSTGHTAAETAALNTRTEAMRRAKDEAARMTDAQAREAARAQIRTAAIDDLDKATTARVASLRGMQDEESAQLAMIAAYGEGTRAVQDLTDAEDARQLVQKAGIVVGDEQYDEAMRAARALIAQRHEVERLKDAEPTIADAREASRQRDAKEAGQDMKRLLTQMQSDLSTFFGDVFTKGIASFRDLFTRIKDMFLKLVADMVAASVVRRVAGAMAGLFGTAATAGAQGAGSNSNPLGAVADWGANFGKGATAGAVGLGVGYGVGSSLYSTSHGTAGNYARGAIGGAAAGAATGFMIAGPAGAAVGAVAGLVGGIIGIGKASRDAQKQMAELQKAVALSMASLRASVNNDAIAAGIAQIEADREQRRKAIEDAYSGGGANSEQVRKRNAALAEMNALENQRIAQLQQEAALQAKQFTDDLRVRDLRSRGLTADADALALQLTQQRERDALIKSFGIDIDPTEAATLALLDQVQAQEKLKAATDAAASSGLNMVQGYRLQAEVFKYMSAPRAAAPWHPGAVPPIPARSTVTAPPQAMASSTSTAAGPQTITIEMAGIYLDSEIVAKSAKRIFKRQAAAQFGDTARWGETA